MNGPLQLGMHVTAEYNNNNTFKKHACLMNQVDAITRPVATL